MIKKYPGLLRTAVSALLCVVSLMYIYPLLLILINSFKSKTFINLTPFTLPSGNTLVGAENYISGIKNYGFLSGLGWSVYITVASTVVILLCTSMFAWYITRVQNKLTKTLFTLCVFSMVVPFQMVMFTLSKTADSLMLSSPHGIIIVYLGFGAGLASFMFCGFVRGVPIAIEEAANIDGCGPVRTFFSVVLPIMQPTYITVGILEAMWIWNDYLLPYLVLDRTRYTTVPILIQSMKGSYGRVDMGAVMACLVLAVIPIVAFYFSCQKYIIKGISAGAVKG